MNEKGCFGLFSENVETIRVIFKNCIGEYS